MTFVKRASLLTITMTVGKRASLLRITMTFIEESIIADDHYDIREESIIADDHYDSREESDKESKVTPNADLEKIEEAKNIRAETAGSECASVN
ncbi:hypothetical protein ElyMa_005642300 [Elysia marginata]|uniref:Uncharacterized protein n=1 Tax=Elysia marginata TaxID=1093978 RepID=A0AAV4F956_9GAST|nr:hypothetical protein ElyMa_005642300 [Elysia marginata]